MSKQEFRVKLKSGKFRKVFCPDKRWTVGTLPFDSYIAETCGYQYTATVMFQNRAIGWVFTDEIPVGSTVTQLLR